MRDKTRNPNYNQEPFEYQSKHLQRPSLSLNEFYNINHKLSMEQKHIPSVSADEVASNYLKVQTNLPSTEGRIG
jgi:hypothetical protein